MLTVALLALETRNVFQRHAAAGSLKMNSPPVTERLQRCLLHEAFHSAGRSCVLCLGRLSSTGTGWASDIGAGRGEPANSRFIPLSSSCCLLFGNSQFYSHSSTPHLFTLVVSLCGAFFLPRQSIYLWLASSSRAAPGVKWRAVGGRARELAT